MKTGNNTIMIMRIRNTTLFAVLSLMALALACTREVEAPAELREGIEMEFTATWAKGESSRTVLQEDGTSIWWSAAERINAFYGNKFSGVFTSTNTNPASSVTFRGTMDVLAGSQEPDNGTSRYWAVYPYNEDNSCDGESVNLMLSHNQTGVDNNFADNFFPAVAMSDTPELAFWNVCGGARFSVVAEGVERVVFRSNDGSPMAGEVTVGFGEDHKPVVRSVTDAKDSVIVNAPAGGFVPGTNYFAVMLPQVHAGGMTVTLYTATKRLKKALGGAVTVHRSAFGTLNQLDGDTATWEEYRSEDAGGGTRSGLYIGVVGFNQELYRMTIERLNAASLIRFKSFIDGLTAKKGTLLYYSVSESMGMLSHARYPYDLFNASIVTFTDGLDQGSSMVIDPYPGDDEYLQGLNTRLYNTRISGVGLTAYSIGLRGSDITDVTKFRSNLTQLACPSSNAFEVSDMGKVNNRFQEIADQLSQTLTRYSYNLSITIPGQADGMRVRFTLDNVSSATSSSRYIEGTFDLATKSLTNVTYMGLTTSAGTTVHGEVNGIFVRFTFRDVVVGNGASDNLSKNYFLHWDYITSTGKWQRNSEFDAENDCTVEVNQWKKTAVVLLNLDCSSSLSGDFSTLKTHAKSFIQRLYNASIDPLDVTGVSLDKTYLKICKGSTTTLIATVTPSTAEDKSVVWKSSNPAVATVSDAGVVEAISEGSCTIEATTTDGGFTASCVATVVIPEAIDLGLSVKWASFNLGASAPEEYGDYFAWGETSTKSNYSWSTYRWCNGSSSTITKYCNNSSYGYNGFTDGKTIIEPDDDVASVVLCGSWRMPTYDEFNELRNNCTWTWTTLNGVYGRKVTSKKSGYTSKWIFLPAAGYKSGVNLRSDTSNGAYWSSTVKTGVPTGAYGVYFHSGAINWDGNNANRELGFSVRPVYGDFIHVTGISLNDARVSFGGTVLLTATITPADAFEKGLTWTSSDTSVASVNADGLVTGIAAGTAMITVTTVDGGYKAQGKVTVYPELTELGKTFVAVDLGLSVKWASFNLGATKPDAYGNYYAWGETSTKSNYDWSKYKWCMYSSSSQLTKYCTNSSYGYNGFTDNKTVLDPEDDAATVNLGGRWRMPTYDELNELKNQCTWEWTTLNGVYGRKVTSKKSGYTNKWIFLPAAGFRDGARLYSGGDGYYWSSSLDTGYPSYAYYVYFDSGNVSWDDYNRYDGRSVRPVLE